MYAAAAAVGDFATNLADLVLTGFTAVSVLSFFRLGNSMRNPLLYLHLVMAHEENESRIKAHTMFFTIVVFITIKMGVCCRLRGGAL